MALLALPALSSGCESKRRQAEVDGVWIAQADALQKVPEGARVSLKEGETAQELPDASNIHLVIPREVLWRDVRAMAERIRKEGKIPHLLVASGREVGAIELEDKLEGRAIEVFVTTEGKLCVRPPKSREAKCVQRMDKMHVDRAFTRELVREAVAAYKLEDVIVEVPPDLQWADLVRAVDGARTCCGDKEVRVRLKR